MSFEKDPGVAATFTIDWFEELVSFPHRSMAFGLGAIVRCEPDTGWLLQCTTAGRTSAHFPSEWPRADGETLTDGSAVWTCKHPDNAAEATVQSATWTVPSGITKDSQSESGALTNVTLSGGTDGVDYDVTCRMTPTAGNPIDKTITIQVRSQ